MGFYWFLIVVSFALLIYYIYEKCKAYTAKAVIIKATVSALFMMVGTYCAFMVPAMALHRGLAFFIVAGLLWGLLGDIWLDLKFVHRSDERIYTYAGFIVFFIGHIIYFVGICKEFGAGHLVWCIVPILVGLVIGVVNVLIGPKMGMDYTGYKGITMLYGGELIGITLSVICLAAFGYYWENPVLNIFAIGYVLFLISDLVLSQTYFKGNESKWIIAANYATYYAAMFIFASIPLWIS